MYIDRFLVFEMLDMLQNERRECRILTHLFTFMTIVSDRKNQSPSIAGGVSVSLQLLALKRGGPGKTMRWRLFDAAECKQ